MPAILRPLRFSRCSSSQTPFAGRPALPQPPLPSAGISRGCLPSTTDLDRRRGLSGEDSAKRPTINPLRAILLRPHARLQATIAGSRSAAFRKWTAADLDQDGKPYWDNVSIDGDKQNVGYFLIDAPTAPLTLAPGALPYWGNAYNSAADTGGTADLNFSFLRSALSSTASLKLENAGNENIDQFGWYDITRPLVLHPLFLGPDKAPAIQTFTPSALYGFYLSGSEGTFYTQSSLNPRGDTKHQHFVVFQESAVPGVETYWLGIEDLTVHGLKGNKGRAGDYNDMLIRICTAVPEPSTAALALVGLLLLLGPLHRHRK